MNKELKQNPAPAANGAKLSAETVRRIHEERGMTAGRRRSDRVKSFFTYLSTFIALFVLGSIFVFVFRSGWSHLNWELITGNYWSGTYLVDLQEQEPGNFTRPADLPAEAAFSEKYGFAVVLGKDAASQEIMELVHLDANSPIRSAMMYSSDESVNEPMVPQQGSDMQYVYYLNENGDPVMAGYMLKQSPEEFVATLDEESTALTQIYYKSIGGGIRGSIITTLMLIGLTVLFSLPIGIFAAIYLHEVAGKSRVASTIRTSIEILNGVPSIIFGLMGMVVFFPLTRLLGATTPNILLGAITMTIVLLPVIIRQTEEALITVPDSLRMGSLSLGATQTQTIFKVVLPNALPGILSAALLSISRIIGESAALIYTVGTSVEDNPKLLGSGTTLAVQIWSEMSGEQPNFALASAISILILIVVLILNLAVKFLTTRLQKKWE